MLSAGGQRRCCANATPGHRRDLSNTDDPGPAPHGTKWPLDRKPCAVTPAVPAVLRSIPWDQQSINISL
jgi:hypothetical protein